MTAYASEPSTFQKPISYPTGAHPRFPKVLTPLFYVSKQLAGAFGFTQQ